MLFHSYIQHRPLPLILVVRVVWVGPVHSSAQLYWYLAAVGGRPSVPGPVWAGHVTGDSTVTPGVACCHGYHAGLPLK